MILSTVPGMTVLGRCETLAVSDSRSAILADFDMRGRAISFWTRTNTSFPGVFLPFFIGSFPLTFDLPHNLLMIQTIKQMTNNVPRIPNPNMVSPASIQQIPLLKVALTVNSFPHQVCSVADMSGIRFLNFSGLRTNVGC